MANTGQQLRSPPMVGFAWANFMPKGFANARKDYFTYGVTFQPLAAGLSGTQTITIQADSDFLIVGANATVTDTANTTFIPPDQRPILATILSTGSGRNLQNEAAAFDNLYGTGSLPGFWPVPKVITRSSSLSTTLQNLDLATAYNVRINYVGIKIFDKLNWGA